MKATGISLTLTAVLLFASDPAPARAGWGCGHRRGGRSARVARPVAAPCPIPAYTMYPPATAMPPAAMASSAGPTYAVAAPPAPAPAAPAPPVVPSPAAAGVAPAYTYNAAPGGNPAYYYTYDKDDRLIPVQWMDWLFRGGREAGELRPPLPIIGRLQGR